MTYPAACYTRLEMDIEELTVAKILTNGAAAELKRLRINSVEAFLARVQEGTARTAFAKLLNVSPESLEEIVHRAQRLVPDFNPAASFGPVSRGALKPSG